MELHCTCAASLYTGFMELSVWWVVSVVTSSSPPIAASEGPGRCPGEPGKVRAPSSDLSALSCCWANGSNQLASPPGSDVECSWCVTVLYWLLLEVPLFTLHKMFEVQTCISAWSGERLLFQLPAGCTRCSCCYCQQHFLWPPHFAFHILRVLSLRFV